jgi:signal transduction histidine kinase/DNA-binding NarL/FixJ family response regulator
MRIVETFLIGIAPVRQPKVRNSISRKLALLALAAVAAGMIAATSLSLWQEAHRYAEAKRASLLAVAEVFASAAAAAVAEADQDRALHAMRAMGRIPGMLWVRIETPRGRLAQLGWVTRLQSDASVGSDQGDAGSIWKLLGSRTMQATIPVIHEGREVGRLTLVADTSDLLAQLMGGLRVAALGGALALLLALLVANRLQRGLTAPLRSLAETVQQISVDHDYTRRVESRSDDEVGVLIDGFNVMVGEIRERDRRIAAHLEGLEQQVADRTHDLRLARDTAEAANAAKSDFLATMSHEIRTPMNGIMVMAELLAAADLPDRQRRYAEVISRSGQSLLAIINDILDLSKIESGKLELERIEVSPAALVEDATSLFGERARSKNLDLAGYVSEEVPDRVLGDPVRVGQVLGNLVNNALKFTERGHVLVKVVPDARMPHGLRFSVTDSGIGIAPEKIASLFEAFSQADQSTTRRYGGTGLGLAICKRLVEAMGGEIEVESRPGEGSSFSFVVPCEPVAVADATDQPPAPADQRVALLAVSGEATRSALHAYFADAGYRAVVLDANREPAAAANVVVADASGISSLSNAPGSRAAARPLIYLAGMGDTQGDKLVRSGTAAGLLSVPLVHSEVASLLRCLVGGQPITTRFARSEQSDLPRFDGLKALVADDSAVNREVAIEALFRLGVSADAVENGRQAVEAFKSAAYDIVLLDGSMPEMDGFDACRHMRALECASGATPMPIVALTAHVVGTAADEWRAAGMNAVMHKPFTVKSLAACFLNLLPVAARPPLGSSGGEISRSSHVPPELVDHLRDMQGTAGSDFVARVCGLYVSHAPDMFAQLRQAFDAADADDMARAAHALKSMSFSIGATAVAERASDIERLALAGDRRPAVSEIKAIEDALNSALLQLAEFSAPRPSHPAAHAAA